MCIVNKCYESEILIKRILCKDFPNNFMEVIQTLMTRTQVHSEINTAIMCQKKIYGYIQDYFSFQKLAYQTHLVKETVPFCCTFERNSDIYDPTSYRIQSLVYIFV